MSYERSLIDRMLGCGTLNVPTAAEDGTVVLADVPDVEHVHSRDERAAVRHRSVRPGRPVRAA